MTPNSPDDDQLVSNDTSPVSQAVTAPATQTQPVQSQPAIATPQAQPSQGTQTPPGVANAAPVHPAVQNAGIVHEIAQTLAGGPRNTYAVDPSTGALKATPLPLTTKEIGLSIALAALSGGIAGLGERGPGATGKAAAVGAATVQAQQQQQDQAAQQQASQNYARQAQIASTNFQTHQNALRLSQMDLNYHKQFVDAATPVLKSVNDVGAVLESGVRESDITSKFHVTKDMAIPDGVIQNGKNPDGSDHWENTYTVIDPSKKIELPQETAQLLAGLRVPGYFTMKDGNAVPVSFSGSAPIKAALVVNGLALAQSFQITEAQLNRQLSSLSGGDKDVPQFDTNLRNAISDGSVTVKGLQVLSAYSNLPVDQAVEQMEKDKVDPTVIQQYRKLIPAGAFELSKQTRADDAKFSVIDTADKAQAVLAAPKRFTTDQVAAARNFIHIAQSDSINKATAEARAHAIATGADTEAMYRFGRNPITGETLSLNNAAPSMLVDPNGNVIPQDLVSTYKPTSQQRTTADTARQVLSISQGLQAQVAANPALIGPLAGRSKQGLAKLGLGDAQAQKLLDDVSLLQSAVTKMHVGARGSEVLLKKSQALINASQNPSQFAGALSSIQEISQRYADEDRLTTVSDWKSRQTPQNGPQSGSTRQVQIPAGAQIGRDAKGNAVGYKLNGQYVPLNGGSQ
jgi:hypothetical protein